MIIVYCRTCMKALAVSDKRISVPSHVTDLDVTHTDIKAIEMSNESADEFLSSPDALTAVDSRFGQYYV